MSLPHFQIKDHLYYITTVVHDRLPIFTRPAYIVSLLDSLNFYRHKLSFKLLGYVLMPDHIHFLIRPYGEASISEIVRDYKKFTSVRIIRQAEAESNKAWLEAFHRAGAQTGRSQNKVWQDDYWDSNVYTEPFLRQKLNYMHCNPVRAGLVNDPSEYPYSSYRNYVLGDETLIEIDMGWV